MLCEIDWELRDLIAPAHTALVVSAMQNDYCHSEGLIAKAGFSMKMTHEMAPRLAGLIAHAQEAGVKVVRIQYEMTEKLPHLPTLRKLKQLGISELITRPGTWGWQWFDEYPEFVPSEGDIVVRAPSFSAFTGTALDLILRGFGIRTLVFGGVTTNGAIEFTARTAFELNYHVVLVEDCAAAREEWLHRAAVWNFQKLYGNVISSDQLVKFWSANAERR
jgi:ureidoacrylate peracid hydrolase